MNKKGTGLLSSAAWNILALMFSAVVGFIAAPIIIRGIGSEGYGLYSIILMIGGFVALQDMGLGEATLMYVAKYHARNDLEGINRVLGATLSVYCLTGAIGCGVIEIFAPQIVGIFKIVPEKIPEAIVSLRIAGGSFLLTTFCGALMKIPEAAQRYDVSSKMQMIMTVIRFGSAIILVKAGFGVVGLAAVLAGSAVVNILAYFVITHRLIPGVECRPHLRKDGFKEVFSYGVFSFINSIIHNLSLYMDRFILGVFFGTADVAYLTAPKDLLMKAQGVSGAASRALFPRFSGMEEGPEMMRLYNFSLWALTSFSVMLFVPAAIVMPVFLSLWVSPEFAEHSAPVARLLAVGLAFNGGVGAYFSLLKGTGRVRWVTVLYIAVAIFSITAMAILVYRYGLIGSGIRMILFSWVGIAICLGVGRKVFAQFPFWRVLVESALLPILFGLIVFFGGCRLMEHWQVDSWVGIVSFAGVAAGMLAVGAMGINGLFFGHRGSGFVLLHKLSASKPVSGLLKR